MKWNPEIHGAGDDDMSKPFRDWDSRLPILFFLTYIECRYWPSERLPTIFRFSCKRPIAAIVVHICMVWAAPVVV
jgi:hypothetical protein